MGRKILKKLLSVAAFAYQQRLGILKIDNSGILLPMRAM